jgi:hypothetical protein
MQTLGYRGRDAIDVDYRGPDGRRISMPRYRCLLIMELVPDVIDDRPAYRFWLIDLDADVPPTPAMARTTDEVIEILQAQWNRRFNPPASVRPESI